MKTDRICRNALVVLMAISLVTVTAVWLTWAMGSRVPAVGTTAEDFRLVDLEGKSQSLSQYRGKVVLVNFWASWCKPCTTEMPAMQTTYDKLRDKVFVVLAINELGAIGMPAIAQHEADLTAYALDHLARLPGIRVFGDADPQRASDRLGVIPFQVEGVSHFLVAAILGYEFGIGVRSGIPAARIASRKWCGV